jgi:hypothetical protein
MNIPVERMFWLMLAVCLLVYIFSVKGYIESTDPTFSLQTAQAMVSHGKLDIPPAELYTLRGRDGRSFSKYGFGLPLYYVPFVVAGNALSRFSHLPAYDLTGFLISFANIPFAILTLILFAKLLKLFGVTGVYVWFFPFVLGLATLMWEYATLDDSEQMHMGLLLLAVYGVARGTPKGMLSGGVGFAALFLVKLVYAAFFPIFLLYVITRPGDLRQRVHRAVLFTFPFVLTGCFVAWLNAVRFGSPLESGYGSEAHQFLPLQLWHTIPQLLGSLDKGLFIFSPILILGVFGWKAFASRYRPEALLCGALIIVNLLVSGAWHAWEGGWAWGPRLLVPTIPLWLLPAAFWIGRRQSRAALWLFAMLTLASIVVQVPGVLVKGQEIHHIKDVVLTADEQRSAPSDYLTGWILLRHKILEGNEVYRVSEFDIPGDREFDLTQYRTFIGLDVWTEQVARQMNKPVLRWLPVLPLFLIGYLAIKLGAALRTAS